MRDGTCTKCGERTVRAARNGISDTAAHTTMQKNHEGRLRGMIVPFQGEAWQFACTSCGYLEWYVLDPRTIQHIETTWYHVEPTG